MLYAIGDIHGERELLEELLASLPFRDGDRLVFVGDYVDRGPDSKGVVETLLRVKQEHDCVFLLGNHESMFLSFLGWHRKEYFGGDAFLMNGGDRTLASYGYFDAEEPDAKTFQLPPDHERFFKHLKLYHRDGDYLFVHAGIGCRLRVTQHPLRGSPLGAHQRRPAAQARCHHRLRPHARGRLLGSLERTLQHRHRHRCSLRRPPHRNPPPRRNPLPGLTNAWSRTAFRAPTLRAARLRESPSGSPTGVR
ncbi:MAG: serine/threonine protein phosphatase [Deltaproteobacteria bacterium]|nr:serine/threonine protein phosphatase [Deltaproteobacteria bacterium]